MYVLIILLAIAVAAVGYLAYRKGDQDGDGDIDLKDLKVSAKDIAEDIKEGVEDVKEWAEDVADEIKDVVDKIRNKPTKANLRTLTKSQLVELAKADHGTELDIKSTKSALVNQVYGLYN